jgi:hypothetical protein
LSFFQCDAGMRSVLRIEHARLVELDIKSGNFRTLELRCLPKLQRFSYDWTCDDYDPLFLSSVPQLSKLALDCVYISNIPLKLSQLLVNAPPISNLHMGFQSEKVLTLIIYISLSLYDGYM